MKLPEPDTVRSYNLFLSSSDEEETRRLRDRVHRLVDDVINPRLADYEEAGVRLAVQRWEQMPAQRVEPGRVNQLFVTRAQRSSLTMVLLLDEIRPGTQQEFEGALADPNPQVSVLVFERPGGSDPAKAAQLLNYLEQYKDQILYNVRCGEPDSDEAWLALVNALLEFTFSAMKQSDERAQGRLTEVRQ
jgi:hypothetical protein